MSILGRLATSALLCCLVVQPAVAQPNLRARIPSDRKLKRLGLELAWWSQATLNPSRDEVSHVTLGDNNVYVQASSGHVTAWDAESGRKLWSALLGRRDMPAQAIITNDKLAIVTVGAFLYAVDKFSGESLWRIRLPNVPSASPGIDDDRIYVGTHAGTLYALDLQTIHSLFQEGRLPEWSRDAIVWQYQSGDVITTPPVPSATGRSVKFASQDGSLYSIQTFPRKLLFQFETDAPVAAPLAVSRERLFLASRDFNFYCLDNENGTVLWDYVSGLPITEAPHVIDDGVYLLPTRGGMHRLDVVTGTRVWWQPNVTEFLAATPARVYASDQVGNVVVLDRERGVRLGAIPMRGFSKRMRNDRTDRLYVATPTGTLLCLREQDREFPIFHKFPERQPLRPQFAPEAGAEPEPPEEPVDNPLDMP